MIEHDHVSRPSDLDRATERELADGYAAHRSVLASADLGLGERGLVPEVRLRTSALDALAIGEQLIRRMTSARWVRAVDALTYGASVDEVAQALDVEPVEVVRGVTEWAGDQLDHGLSMTAERHAEVLRLVGGGR